MGVNDIAVRFTEGYYATKKEVSKELKISVIDGVWDKILSYRAPFCHYLSIRGIDKNQLRVCLCPSISSKLNNVEAKLLRIISESNKLDSVNGDRQHFLQTQLIKCLQNVALCNLTVSDEEYVRRVVHGQSNDVSLSHYLDSLKYIERHYVNNINEDFLADLYSKVTGNNELTYFYRTSDVETVNSSALISRVYKCAPAMLIETMMNSLFNFIEKSTISPLCRALISYYYVQFVKPFNDHNSEIAVLIAKSVLAHHSLGEIATYLPLEVLLNENEAEVSRLFQEVQTSSDVTYYLVFALSEMDKEFDKILDSLAEYSAQIIKNDFYKEDIELVPEAKPVEEPIKEEPPVIEKVEVQPAPAPVIEPVKVAPAPKKEEPLVEKPAGIAVSYIPEELDEKTAQRLERHLLELDVRLKKAQAAFYARHCTLGMYYTIDQYKKATKCVYETARTSMDKLVEFGYYEKGEYGKKFVYTPVKRK